MSFLALSPSGRRSLAICALGGALALGVSACGSSSSSSTTASAAAGAGASSNAAYTARLNYAKCMRAHNVNVPDPSPNAGPAGGAGGGGFRALRSSPNFASANQACAKYRAAAGGFGNLSSAQRAQFQQDLVKFAVCMRSYRIEIPDPSTSSGGGFGIFRSIPSSERNSPVFQKALKACSSTLPFRRGGAGGGPPAGGGSGA
jgi:hypothetical protein